MASASTPRRPKRCSLSYDNLGWEKGLQESSAGTVPGFKREIWATTFQEEQR
jgi:hypothetical protein